MKIRKIEDDKKIALLMEQFRKMPLLMQLEFQAALGKALEKGGGITADMRNGFVRWDPPDGPEAEGHA